MVAISAYADSEHMKPRKQGDNLMTARGKVPLLYLAKQQEKFQKENGVCQLLLVPLCVQSVESQICRHLSFAAVYEPRLRYGHKPTWMQKL